MTPEIERFELGIQSFNQGNFFEAHELWEEDWKVAPTLIERGASIGSGATILGNLTVGENAIVGAGSVVTRSVPANSIVAGNPARVLRTEKAASA